LSGGYVVVTAGGVTDKAGVSAQHPGDTWYTYITPDYRGYQDTETYAPLPMNVVVGATVAIGQGVVINAADPGYTGQPIQTTCNWKSSNPSIATVDRLGHATAVSPGSVTISCGRAGNAVYGNSTASGWVSPGNVITLNIVSGGIGSTTWYVRPNGGTPYTNSTDTPNGQCDGKHDADYPGSGVNQPCAFGNVRDLWSTEVGYQNLHWIISGGDTVIVRQNPNGYNLGLDEPYSNGWAPGNCAGDAYGCYMPTIPSGTASRHTRILGENYASCHTDSAKTKLNLTYLAYAAINVRDSQFVDVGCFEITDEAACTSNNNYTNSCSPNSNAGGNGVLESALTASVNYTDLFIHGLMHDGITGAAGIGVVADYVHIRAMPNAGINMDDGPWQTGNISVAGGFTLTNSITEFIGCVEEYPVVHNYPYIECRDQSTGSYGDGLGTASTTGDWLFDHDIWRYNFQDGLDLLHSGMRSLTVTNSQSYGNDGQAYKIGSGEAVIFRNNIAEVNCNRIAYTIGDEPSSAIVPGVSTCRAAGDGVIFSYTGQGTYQVQNNTFVGYNSTMFDLFCEGGWDSCPNAQTVFQNNVVLGYVDTIYGDGRLPGLFYLENAVMPPNSSWAVRDHNIYYNVRYCPTPLQTGEVCNTTDPQFAVEPASPITSEATMDSFNFAPASSSPLIGAGISIAAITTDITGATRNNPPSIGAIEAAGSGGSGTPPSSPPPPPSLSPATVALNEEEPTLVVGQTETFTATVALIGGVTPTGTISFFNGTSPLGTATLSGLASASFSTSSLGVGTYNITAVYSGDSVYSNATSSPVSLSITAAANSPPPPPPGAPVSIAVGQPMYGFNVIPGSTRRIFTTVTNGTTNQVSWAVKSGSGKLSSNSGSWIDVTAPSTGSSCQISESSSQYVVASSTQFTIEATSGDDPTQKANVTFNVCNPTVEISVVPFYRAVYANQPVDLQSFVLGSTDPSVHWAISSQPQGGDGSLTDTTSRDTVFTATVSGRYHLTATSEADGSKSATAIVYVTGHSLPYRVTPNLTEPVDCSVDPSSVGQVYEVGPSQAFKTLAAVPFPTMVAGSTVRLHNEDTTGLHPTEYHEYVQISQAGTSDQPIRVCGVPDTAGNLPVIDGSKATGRSDDSSDVAGLGIITLHNPSNQSYWPNYSAAAYVVVEGLQLRNANSSSSFTSPSGSQAKWSGTSAAIRINQGQNTVFVGNDINSNSTGVLSAFNSSGAWGSSDVDVLWEGNHIHNNGVAGSASSHQMDLQAWGEVVQFNRVDGYVSGGLGSNIKSRGIQGVIRYNYLGDGPARQVDLVDVQNATPFMSFEGLLSGGSSSVYATSPQNSYPVDRIAAEQEAWNSHYVYGNIYQNSVSTSPVHFGEELSGGEAARKGSLYWYNNTFYQKLCSGCSGQTWTMFDTAAANGAFLAQTEYQTVQAFDNIIWMDNPQNPVFQFNNYDAFIGVAGKNLLPANWGSNNTAGGSGTGWVATVNSAAYQGAENLSLHLTGFTGSNLVTQSSIPFDSITWTLSSDVSGQQSLPTAVCQMPVRFAYLPSLGYVIPRTDAPNVGATDTAAETATQMNAVAGNGRYHTRYSTCR